MTKTWTPLGLFMPEDPDDRRFNFMDTEQVHDPFTGEEFPDCYGIVDEELGGFVAYAVGEEMAQFIVNALRLKHGVF